MSSRSALAARLVNRTAICLLCRPDHSGRLSIKGLSLLGFVSESSFSCGMVRMNTKNNGTGKLLSGAMGLAAGISFGFGGAVSSLIGAQGFSVMHIVMAQFICAVVIMGVLTIFSKRPKFSAKTIAQLVVLGAVSTISSITYYLAINLLSVGSAVAIQFQYVWMTVVIQAIAERKAPNGLVIVAVFMVIVGTLFASGLADEFLSGAFTANALGLVFALICAVFYALFIFFNGRIAPDEPAAPRTFVMVSGGFIVALFVGGDLFLNPSELVALLPGGLVLGLMMSVIPVLCIVGASSRLPGGIVAILTSTELPAAVLAGALIFGDAVTPLVVIGVVLILVSVALVEGGDALKLKQLNKDPA